MNDVVERIRKAETMPLDPDGKAELWKTLQDALAEIKRLRLTDAERGAVERAADWLVTLAATRKEIQVAGYLVDDAATLRGLLARCAIGHQDGHVTEPLPVRKTT